MKIAHRWKRIEGRIEVKRISRAAVVCVAACMSGAWAAEDPSKEELKRDAVSRVVEAHDVALPVYIGRVYVKQAALTAARDLLAQKGRTAGLDRKNWNMDSPQWQQGAESELMQGTLVGTGCDNSQRRRGRRDRRALSFRGWRTATPWHRMVRRGTHAADLHLHRSPEVRRARLRAGDARFTSRDLQPAKKP